MSSWFGEVGMAALLAQVVDAATAQQVIGVISTTIL